MKGKRSTHIDENGNIVMVDISNKDDTERFAKAKATMALNENSFNILLSGKSKKGEIFPVAKIAGIIAAKKTHEMIPLCHPIRISSIDIKFKLNKEDRICEIYSVVKGIEKTGFEMEALVAVTTASLTIYDMLKSVDKGIIIKEIKLIEKYGGKSGHFISEN